MAGIIGEFISALVKSVGTALKEKTRRRTAKAKPHAAKHSGKTVKTTPAAKSPARATAKNARIARKTTRRTK